MFISLLTWPVEDHRTTVIDVGDVTFTRVFRLDDIREYARTAQFYRITPEAKQRYSVAANTLDVYTSDGVDGVNGFDFWTAGGRRYCTDLAGSQAIHAALNP